MTETAAPEPITVTRHRCPFCRRSWAHRAAAGRHIPRCWLNPAARSCKTCAHFEAAEDACGCQPGCNWGSPDGGPGERCNAGVNLRSVSRGLPVNCPLWALWRDPCADCGEALTVADLDGKRYCRVDAGRRLAAGEDVTYDENPADGESPSVATDCQGSGIFDCPCEADGQPDGRCACCRSGEANGSCALLWPGMGQLLTLAESLAANSSEAS